MREENINTNNKKGIKENIESEEEDKTELKILSILSQYKNGISSIFEESDMKEENYFFILFKCPENFRLKYQTLTKQNLNESINLKLYADYSSKQNIKEKITNLEENLNIKAGELINKYIIILNQVFEKFFGTNLKLLEKLISTYFEIKKNEKFEYEDFILLFCSIIKYYSGLNISLELSNSENYLFIYIFGDENSYTKICKKLNYNLQLNPIAIYYEKNNSNILRKETNKDNILKNIEFIDYDDKEPLLQPSDKELEFDKIQFEDYDINNPIFWPPYYPYKKDKDEKFRKYEPNDDYHYSKDGNGKNDFDNNYISKFRNIDKLRFIQRILNQIIKFSSLKKIEFFEMMIFKRNNKSYKKKLNELSLTNIYNPFDYKKCNKTINFME